jgi:hypothetical protein
MTTLTPAQVAAGVVAGRAALVTAGYSDMVPDAELVTFVTDVETAMVVIPPGDPQVQAGVTAGRQALENYSWIDSMAVSDDALEVFVTDIATAMNAVPNAPEPPAPTQGS